MLHDLSNLQYVIPFLNFTLDISLLWCPLLEIVMMYDLARNEINLVRNTKPYRQL